MDVSRTELLEAIRRVLSGAGPEVRVGVGDDAAVVAPGLGRARPHDRRAGRGRRTSSAATDGGARPRVQGDRRERERHRGDGRAARGSRCAPSPCPTRRRRRVGDGAVRRDARGVRRVRPVAGGRQPARGREVHDRGDRDGRGGAGPGGPALRRAARRSCRGHRRARRRAPPGCGSRGDGRPRRTSERAAIVRRHLRPIAARRRGGRARAGTAPPR